MSAAERKYALSRVKAGGADTREEYRAKHRAHLEGLEGA